MNLEKIMTPRAAHLCLLAFAMAGLAESGEARAQAIFTTAPPAFQRLQLEPPAPSTPQFGAGPANQARPSASAAATAPAADTQQAPRASYAVSSPTAPEIPRPAPRDVSPWTSNEAPPQATTRPVVAVAPIAGGGVKTAENPASTARPPLRGGPPSLGGSAILRHLTNNIQGFRLTGEIGSSEWPFFVTDAQTQNKLRFQVGYLAAVSVMPEASYLTLVINDMPVGRTNIIGTHGVRTAVFDIPDGLVKPGFNSVRLVAEQRHRVDCSLQATYELWTQIDPTQTGLILPKADNGVTKIAELAAFPPDEEGAMPIRAVVPARATLANVERLVRAVQMISLAGRFAQPLVDVGPMADGEYGINLAIGTVAEISGLIGDVQLGDVTGPRVIVMPAAPGRRATVIATGRTDDDVNQALARFAVAEQMRGSPEGLRAAADFPGYRMYGGARVKLRDLGIASQEFSGRMFRAAFNIMMPPDFYSADYAKAVLYLSGGYAPGLTNAAQIVVSVNDRNAVSIKLPKSRGDVFKDNPVPLPLGSLRPGLNRIEIEAQLPVESDSSCDPLAAISGQKRFLFLDSSELELPRIARIARMPDLAVTATGGFPYAGGEKRPSLFVPAPSREALGAAATLSAYFAIAAGKVIDYRLTVTDPGKEGGSTIVVAPAPALGEQYLRSVGIDPPTLQTIWGDKLGATPTLSDQSGLSRYEAMARHRLVLQRNFPASCHMATPTGGFRSAEKSAALNVDRAPVASIDNGRDGPPRALYDEWDTNIHGAPGILSRGRAAFVGVQDWIVDKLTVGKSWVGDRFQRNYNRQPFTRQASLIVAQNILGDTSDDVRTIVTAPNAAQLAQSVNCLVDPRVWRQIGGRIAVLNASEGEVLQVPTEDPRFIPTQPLSIENARLISAGWLSLNSQVYVEMALILAIALAFTTNRFLSGVGRKRE